MLTALLGALTATLFGSSDFLGGLASRRSPALWITTVVYAMGVASLTLVLLLLRPAALTRLDVTWAVASGFAGTAGVLSLYAALASGRMGIVAPVTAALAGAGPAVFDFVTGVHVRPSALVGLGLALVAVIVVSTITDSEDEHHTPPRAVALAVTAGVGFGVSLICLSRTAPASGLAPLLVARVTGFAVLVLAIAARQGGRGQPSLQAATLRIAAAAGLLDAAANVTMLSAVRIGPLAVASVIGALYPVATILLARTVLRERLHGQQVVGVVLALAAVVLTALP